MRVVVTGANGFVGTRLVRVLREAGHEVKGSVRHGFEGFDPEIHAIVSDGGSHANLLRETDVLVHAAGVAHRPEATREDYFAGNRDMTLRLAGEVAASGVRAMIHLSSIAARETGQGGSGRPSDYGLSKLEAEPAVEALVRHHKLGVNLRPPLIYGPDAPGNWGRLVRLARLPLPLPFASVRNRRSYLALDHLVEAVLAILARADQPGLSGTYEIADRETPSLPEVLASVRRGMSRKPGLVPFPPSWISGALRIAGKAAMADGLLGDLSLDASPFEDGFSWRPSSPTLEAMARSVT